MPDTLIETRCCIAGGGRVTGVRGIMRTPQGEPDGNHFEVRADLVVAADGRHSAVREATGMVVRDRGTPIDVLWMRLPRAPGDPDASGGRIEPGRFLATIKRQDYWQCAYAIAKGGIADPHARGRAAFRQELVSVAPMFAGRG